MDTWRVLLVPQDLTSSHRHDGELDLGLAPLVEDDGVHYAYFDDVAVLGGSRSLNLETPAFNPRASAPADLLSAPRSTRCPACKEPDLSRAALDVGATGRDSSACWRAREC